MFNNIWSDLTQTYLDAWLKNATACVKISYESDKKKQLFHRTPLQFITTSSNVMMLLEVARIYNEGLWETFLSFDQFS